MGSGQRPGGGTARNGSPAGDAAPEATGAIGVVLLVDLGTDGRQDMVRAQGLEGAVLFRTCLADLDAALLAEVRPEIVIGPLIGRDCDAMTLIAHLQALGYQGRIIALARPLPNRAMVERELRVAAGSLRVDLIEWE